MQNKLRQNTVYSASFFTSMSTAMPVIPAMMKDIASLLRFSALEGSCLASSWSPMTASCLAMISSLGLIIGSGSLCFDEASFTGWCFLAGCTPIRVTLSSLLSFCLYRDANAASISFDLLTAIEDGSLKFWNIFSVF